MVFSLRFHRLSLLTGVLLLTAGATLAQDPGSGGPQPGAQDPTAVPIDGGASLLLAAGVGIGLRQLQRSRAAKH